MDGKHWCLEKYARFLQTSISSTEGKWQVYSDTKENRLTISIKEPLQLLIQHGSNVMESLNFIKSRDWVKAISKNDSVLFITKLQDKIRRFRVKFVPVTGNSPSDALTQCNEFVSVISKYVQVQKVNEKPSGNQKSGKAECEIVTVKSIAENVLNKQAQTLPLEILAQTNLLANESGTSSLIKTCLLDPSFPSFVENVEKTLMQMIDSS